MNESILNRNVRIKILLFPNRSALTMTTIHLRIVRQGEQTRAYGLAKLIEIAARQVGAPDASAEKGIAREDPTFCRSIKTDASTSMTRRANHLQNAIANPNLFIILQLHIGKVYVSDRLKTQPNCLTLGLREIGMRIRMCCHRDAVATFHGTVAHHMIHMTMGIDDHQRLQLMTVKITKEAVFLFVSGTSRIHNNTFLGFIIYYIGVFPERIEHKGIDLKHIDLKICWAKVRRIPYFCRFNPNKMQSKKKRFLRLMLVAMLTVISSLSQAQFYNGMNMEFGKNRVQWTDFHWSYYKYETFDVYFYQGGNELANYVLNYAKDEIPEMEKRFGNHFGKKVQFLVFNSLGDLKQSNLNNDEEDTGNDEQTVLAGIDAMEAFFRAIGMPTNLRELGAEPTEEEMRLMARMCVASNAPEIGSAKVFREEDMHQVYKAAAEA